MKQFQYFYNIPARKDDGEQLAGTGVKVKSLYMLN